MEGAALLWGWGVPALGSGRQSRVPSQKGGDKSGEIWDGGLQQTCLGGTLGNCG